MTNTRPSISDSRKVSTEGLSLPILLALAFVLLSFNESAYAQGFATDHPRRAQVLARNAHLRHSTNANKGQLGGHYAQLRAEQIAIRKQQRHYKNVNDGSITNGQQEQLNDEQNGVRKQINRWKGTLPPPQVVPPPQPAAPTMPLRNN